jgi:hypothetical protein
MKRNLAVAAICVAAALVAGCGGGEVLSIWKVSDLPGAKPASCYKGGIDPNAGHVSTSTVEEYLGDWELYDSAKSTLQLHVGQDVYDGADKGGGSYVFSGLVTDKTIDNPDSPTRTITVTKTLTLTLQIDGDTFTGTRVTLTTDHCDGGACASTYQDDHPDCTVTDAIRGTKILTQIIHAEP